MERKEGLGVEKRENERRIRNNLYSCVTTIYSIYHFTNMIIACFVASTHHAFQDTFPTEEILLVQIGLLDFTVSTMTT